LYDEYCANCELSVNTQCCMTVFWKEFNSMNLSLFSPKKDQIHAAPTK